MEVGKKCPVCGIASVTPLARRAMMASGSGGSPSLDDATVFGYRCAKGHYFFARKAAEGKAEGEKAATKPAA